jgi:hypothetical protein
LRLTIATVSASHLLDGARPVYNENSVRPERVEARTFEMETPSGKKGKPSIRASLLPPDFQSLDPNGFLMTVPRLETAVVDHQQALGCHEKV